jgi:ring-1,2-phenylacetyl-CoA epoxidase subunit PaaA
MIRARHAPAVSSWAVGAAFTARDAAPAQRTQSHRFGRRLRYAVLQGPGRRDVFSDRVEQNDLPRQDPEYVDLLRRVLAIQADCEIGGPHLYVDAMLPSAPTAIDQLVVARTAAEEIDHFRKFARLAGDIGVDTAYLLSRSNQERYLEAFRGLITTWEDFAVFGFLIDRVGRYQLEEFAGCTYAPLSRLLEHPSRVMEEEAGHIDFGTTRTAEMAARGGEARERVQRAVDFWYLTGLDMFGRSESRRAERYRYWGLKRRSNAEARQQYIAEVNPLLLGMGLNVPDPLAGRKYL